MPINPETALASAGSNGIVNTDPLPPHGFEGMEPSSRLCERCLRVVLKVYRLLPGSAIEVKCRRCGHRQNVTN